MKVKIKRLKDGLTKQGELSWIKYRKENDTFSNEDGNTIINKPEIGCSLCLDAGWNPT